MVDRRATMTIEESADYLGICRSGAYSAAQRKELPGAFKIGGRWLVSKAILEKFIADGGQLDQPKVDTRVDR
jgi:excisionase family DNA binding protein